MNPKIAEALEEVRVLLAQGAAAGSMNAYAKLEHLLKSEGMDDGARDGTRSNVPRGVVALCDGKYTFYQQTKPGQMSTTLFCNRYSEHWREFLGDHAVVALYEEVLGLRSELDTCRAERMRLQTVVDQHGQQIKQHQVSEDNLRHQMQEQNREHQQLGQQISDALGRHRGHDHLVEAVKRVRDERDHWEEFANDRVREVERVVKKNRTLGDEIRPDLLKLLTVASAIYQKLDGISMPAAIVEPPGSKQEVGLYQKFLVRRTDGRDTAGEKHYACRYFVLDLSHDKYAMPALFSYAQACRIDYPQLANDLMTEVERMHDWVDPNDAVCKSVQITRAYLAELQQRPEVGASGQLSHNGVALILRQELHEKSGGNPLPAWFGVDSFIYDSAARISNGGRKPTEQELAARIVDGAREHFGLKEASTQMTWRAREWGDPLCATHPMHQRLDKRNRGERRAPEPALGSLSRRRRLHDRRMVANRGMLPIEREQAFSAVQNGGGWEVVHDGPSLPMLMSPPGIEPTQPPLYRIQRLEAGDWETVSEEEVYDLFCLALNYFLMYGGSR